MYAVYKWHRSAEEISIRTNGANRKASLTNGDFFTNGSIGEGFLTIGICLCILDMCGPHKAISVISPQRKITMPKHHGIYFIHSPSGMIDCWQKRIIISAT